jgi:Protein of unknown function (DUF2000)
MLYANNDFKSIAILNAKIERPQLMNALGHMTAGLISQAKNDDQMSFLQYPFHDDGLTPATISLYPFIILQAKNGNQIKTLHESASSKGILHNVFTNTMLGASAIDQMEATKNTKPEDLIYFGVTLFGDSHKLAELTRKFSLFTA